MLLSILRVACYIFLWPIRVKVNWVIYLCLTDGYLKCQNIRPFPCYCSCRVLAIMIMPTCSAVMQTTSARISMLNGKYFHSICITIVWNMILALSCRQVSNMLQKLHARLILREVRQLRYQHDEKIIVRKIYFCDVTSKRHTSARQIHNIFNIWSSVNC